MTYGHVGSVGEQEAAGTSFVQLFDSGFPDVAVCTKRTSVFTTIKPARDELLSASHIRPSAR